MQKKCNRNSRNSGFLSKMDEISSKTQLRNFAWLRKRNRPFAQNTWYKIKYTGEQVAQGDFQNKGRSRWTGTSCFVLEVPLCNLLTSIFNFVPCDRIVQRAYCNKASRYHAKSRSKNATRFEKFALSLKIPKTISFKTEFCYRYVPICNGDSCL